MHLSFIPILVENIVFEYIRDRLDSECVQALFAFFTSLRHVSSHSDTYLDGMIVVLSLNEFALRYNYPLNLQCAISPTTPLAYRALRTRRPLPFFSPLRAHVLLVSEKKRPLCVQLLCIYCPAQSYGWSARECWYYVGRDVHSRVLQRPRKTQIMQWYVNFIAASGRR